MIVVYQLKAGLCLAVFYLLFKLLLSRDALHRQNRAVLLLTATAAMVLPLVRLSVAHGSPLSEAVIGLDGIWLAPAATEAVGSATARSLSPAGLLQWVGLAGMAITAAWQAAGLWRLRRLLRSGRTEQMPDGTTLHILPGDTPPFSYFGHVAISENDYRHGAQEILIHEQAHARLHHSADILYATLLTIMQWWNPAAWLMKRELKQIHEFEADQAVLERGVDARQYQLLLIRKSVGEQLFSMANNLNHNSLKRRIRMMKHRESSPWQRLKVLAIVPAAAALVVACGQKSADATAAEQEAAEAKMATIEVEAKTYDVVEQMPEFPGGTVELMEFLQRNLKYPEDAQQAGTEGRVIVTFIVDADGTVTDAEVVRGVSPSLDEEALRVVSLMPQWNPGRQSGDPVRVKYTLPVTFRLK